MNSRSHSARTFVAFGGGVRLAEGDLLSVALAMRDWQAANQQIPALVFDRATGARTDVDLQGDDAEIERWIRTAIPDALDQAPPPGRGRGRPKLGVVAREVTLLPRQWEWLGRQTGGASAALRRLVDQAAKSPEERRKVAQTAAYRLATALAGDEPGYEEAMRALYAGDAPGFETHSKRWPEDVRAEVLTLARASFSPTQAAAAPP